jgi:hypothetical protein
LRQVCRVAVWGRSELVAKGLLFRLHGSEGSRGFVKWWTRNSQGLRPDSLQTASLKVVDCGEC